MVRFRTETRSFFETEDKRRILLLFFSPLDWYTWDMKTSEQLPSSWVVVRFSALGDVVLTTGVLDYWHRTRGWNFVVVTREVYAPLFEGHPAVRNVVGLDAADMRFPRFPLRMQELAAAYADCGLLDLHGTLRSRLMSLLWRGPVRHYDKMSLERRLHLAIRRIPFREKLLRWNVPQRYATAIETPPPARRELLPHVRLSEAELTVAGSILSRIAGGHGGPAPVALHPYATHPDKAWKPDSWARIAEHLETARIPWFVIGSGNPLPGIDSGHDLTNRTSLRETCALLYHASVLITGDSGPMHLAASVGTPVLALFGPTTAVWGFYPAGSRDSVLETDLPCRPCTLHGKKRCSRDHACMKGISPDQVMQALDQFLR